MRPTLLLFGLALVVANSFAQFVETRHHQVNPEVCNCPPVGVSSATIYVTVPSGVTFTGNCAGDLCQTNDTGGYQVSKLFQIPQGLCLVGVVVKLEFPSDTTINCDEDSDCPSGLSVPADFIGWGLPAYLECAGQGEPGDPGVGWNCDPLALGVPVAAVCVLTTTLAHSQVGQQKKSQVESVQTTQSVPLTLDELAERFEQNSRYLREAVERYNIALMYDLPENPIMVPASDAVGALDWLAMTAAANDRVLLEIDGTYVLIRPDRPPGSANEGDRSEIVGLLNRLGDSQLRAALEGTLTLGDLAPADRAIFMRNMMNWNGMTSFYGGRHEQAAQFSSVGANAVIKLSLGEKYTAAVAQGRTHADFERDKLARSNDNRAEVADLTSPTGQASSALSGMPLDFGLGRSMSVAELLRQANREFDLRLRIDGRVLGDPVFVSGGYDEQSFRAAAEVLLRLRQMEEAPVATKTLERLEAGFVARIRRMVDPNQLTEEETISMSELRRRTPVSAELLEARYDYPEDGKVDVSQGFMLTVNAAPTMLIGIYF